MKITLGILVLALFLLLDAFVKLAIITIAQKPLGIIELIAAILLVVDAVHPIVVWRGR